MRRPLVLGVGVGIQLLLGVTGTPWPLLVVSMALIAAFLFLNRERAGFPLALTGLLLNLIVIAANGAMPVSAHAARIAKPGISIAASDHRHVYAGPETHLSWLGDVIPVAGKVVSIGDVLMALGLVWFIAAVAVERPRSAPLQSVSTAENGPQRLTSAAPASSR